MAGDTPATTGELLQCNWLLFLAELLETRIVPQVQRGGGPPPLPLQVNYFSVTGCFSWQSFWKRGSFRSGSNMGSNRSNAGVSGGFEASGASYGRESSFSKAVIARSGSPICAATRARI